MRTLEAQAGKLTTQEARSVRQLVERSGQLEDACIERVLNRRCKILELTITFHEDGTHSVTSVEREFTSERARKKYLQEQDE